VSAAVSELATIFRAEHAEPVPEQASLVTREIVRRHGPTVSAVLFYGSCLRKRQLEGSVLDFYAIVDSYREAYRSKWLAVANRVLPPNVFLLSVGEGAGQVHSKYAVISWADFIRGAEGLTLHSIVWARFCQPSRVTWARDDSTRERVAEACGAAAITMVRTALSLSPPPATAPLDSEHLWQGGFRATYGTEMRTERPETIRELYASCPERYDRVTALALDELARSSELEVVSRAPSALVVRLDAARFAGIAARWRRRSRAAKVVYVARLVKSALTFGDWVPYALFKLGRHTNVKIELTPLQRRHPLIFGWPVFFKLLRSQKLR
jgi:hypothetical protein